MRRATLVARPAATTAEAACHALDARCVPILGARMRACRVGTSASARRAGGRWWAFHALSAPGP